MLLQNGEFKPGDKVIYFEIDSLLPDIPAFEFLKGSSWSQKLNKYKIRTHKMRGQISQGLVISINQLPEIIKDLSNPDAEVMAVGLEYLPEGMDLTEILQIEKYEPPVSNGDLGEIISHEWYVPKTDEERIQTCAENVLPAYMYADSGDWYTSIKLDGTSCTFGLYDDGFYVSGRNQFYKGPNMYTDAVNSFTYGNTEEAFKRRFELYGEYVIFQGELCGPGIQGNKLGLREKTIYVFNAFVSTTGKPDSYKKLNVSDMIDMCNDFYVKHVPVLTEAQKFDFTTTTNIDETVENLLAYADTFKYRDYFEFENVSPNQIAEGLVFRMNDMSNSFKVISNKFLLKGGE